MTDSTEGYCAVYKPSLRERFWRKLGFHFHLGELEPTDVPWHGWMQTRSFLYLGLADRLRLLVSGKLRLQHTCHLDTPSPDKIHTRFDWEILQPGSRAKTRQ